MRFLSKSWLIFEALGVPVRVHASFLAILAVVGFTSLSLIPVYAILVTSVLVHEYGHVLVARRFGNECSVIYLHFFGGAAMLQPSRSLKEDWVVSIAGPLTSLALGILFFFLFYMTGLEIVGLASAINLLIAVFNMLPVYPMDGGRIYKAVMENFFGRRTGTLIALWTARVLALAGAMFGLISGHYMFIAVAVAIVYFGVVEQSALKRMGLR